VWFYEHCVRLYFPGVAALCFIFFLTSITHKDYHRASALALLVVGRWSLVVGCIIKGCFGTSKPVCSGEGRFLGISELEQSSPTCTHL
jgi:hypothetical protein